MASKIQSINIVEVYEENGQELNGLTRESLAITIREHWNRKELVVIKSREGSYTVCASDLQKAIQNAQNAHSGF